MVIEYTGPGSFFSLGRVYSEKQIYFDIFESVINPRTTCFRFWDKTLSFGHNKKP